MATAVFTTVVDRSVGDPLTEAIWDDQLRDNLNQLASAHQSLLVNGGFERSQRGGGPFVFTSLNSGYTADRWLVQSNAGCTSTSTPEVTIVAPGSGVSLKVVTSGGTALVVQKYEYFYDLRGRTVSFSCQVQQSAASAVTIYIEQTSGATVSATSATTGSFVTFTVTAAIASNTSIVQVAVTIASGATVYLDNAMLVIGPAPAPYQPLHPADDLARCQRYYEVHGGVADEFPDIAGSATAGALSFRSSIAWAVLKGGVPTVTKNGTWAVLNCAQPTVSAATPSGYSIQCVSTAGGQYATNPNSTDDTITSEWNP